MTTQFQFGQIYQTRNGNALRVLCLSPDGQKLVCWQDNLFPEGLQKKIWEKFQQRERERTQQLAIEKQKERAKYLEEQAVVIKDA